MVCIRWEDLRQREAMIFLKPKEATPHQRHRARQRVRRLALSVYRNFLQEKMARSSGGGEQLPPLDHDGQSLLQHVLRDLPPAQAQVLRRSVCKEAVFHFEDNGFICISVIFVSPMCFVQHVRSHFYLIRRAGSQNGEGTAVP